MKSSNPSFSISCAGDAQSIANQIRPYLIKLGFEEATSDHGQETLKTTLLKEYQQADVLLVLISQNYPYTENTSLEWELIKDERSKNASKCFFVRIDQNSIPGLEDTLTAYEWQGNAAEVAVEVFAALGNSSSNKKDDSSSFTIQGRRVEKVVAGENVQTGDISFQ